MEHFRRFTPFNQMLEIFAVENPGGSDPLPGIKSESRKIERRIHLFKPFDVECIGSDKLRCGVFPLNNKIVVVLIQLLQDGSNKHDIGIEHKKALAGATKERLKLAHAPVEPLAVGGK